MCLWRIFVQCVVGGKNKICVSVFYDDDPVCGGRDCRKYDTFEFEDKKKEKQVKCVWKK